MRVAATACVQISRCRSCERANSRLRRLKVRQRAIRCDASIDVLAKGLAQQRLRGRGEQVDAQVSGADRVGLVDRLTAPHVEARESPRERERNQQAEEREHRGLERADVWHARGTVARDSPPPEPAPEHEAHQYPEKYAGGDDGAEDRGIDDLKHVFGRRLTGRAWLVLPGEQHHRRKDRGFQAYEHGFAFSANEQGDGPQGVIAMRKPNRRRRLHGRIIRATRKGAIPNRGS